MSDNQLALSVLLSPKRAIKELEGFSLIPSDGMPFITLDKERRFYFNSAMRKIFGLKPYDKIAIGYNPDTQSIAIVTKNTEALPPSFVYMLDKRYYASARRFVKDYRIPVDKLPITYYFEHHTSVDGVYIFRQASVD